MGCVHTPSCLVQRDRTNRTPRKSAVGAIFVSSGVCEFLLSPIAGLLADRLGFDAVVSFGLLVLSVKCLLYGLLDTTIVTVSVGRLLQGVAGACLQPIGIARITDLYDSSSKECSNILAVAMAKIAFNNFAGLVTGQLFNVMKQRVFLLFIPISVLLMFGVLVTFRATNFHSSTQSDGDIATTHNTESKILHWRVFGDVQVISLALCFFVADIGRTSLEPSMGIWMKSAFGADVATISLVFGLCGLAILFSSLVSPQVLPIFRHRSWIFGIVTLWLAGFALMLLNLTHDVQGASFALFVHYFAASGTRFVLISMCSTLTETRYIEESGLVFGVTNTGLAAAILVGPLVSVVFFDPVCLIYATGATYLLFIIPMAFLRQLDSKYRPNIMDYFQEGKPCEYQVVGYPPRNIPVSFRSVPVQLGSKNHTN